ncbi:MAG: hypothetical protein ACFFDK_08355 [Promethearchaeota archaeon]
MKLQILLEKPTDKILLFTFLVTFILTWVFVFLIFATLLAQFPPGAGLMEMKAAWNKKNMDKIITIWKKKSLSRYVELMTIVNNLDFVFMFVYGTAVFTGLLLVARQLKDSEKLQKFYLNLSMVSWVSVLFDVIEGIFIAIILFNPSNITEVSALGVSLSATLCIIVLYSCVLLWIIGLIIVLIKRIKK